VFRPEDIHIATLVGALNQINYGVTTLVDWCHNNPTPAHTNPDAVSPTPLVWILRFVTTHWTRILIFP
jgi:hypothetical protein